MCPSPVTLGPPRKDESLLKRPNLIGDFPCKSCGREFRHRMSLKRHRETAHSTEHTCQLCNRRLTVNETIPGHMKHEHNLGTVFTCGCCNYTYENKILLARHLKSVDETGTPGDAISIGKTDHAPGSLLQSAIRGIPRPVKIPRRRNFKKSVSPSSTSSSSSSAVFRAPTLSRVPDAVLENFDPIQKIFNDAVDAIFQSAYYTSEQITVLDTWQGIVNMAASIVATHQQHMEMVKSEKVVKVNNNRSAY